MPNTRNKWTEREHARLIELYQQGLTNLQICEQLGKGANDERSKSSIAHRIELLKHTKQLEEKRRTRTSEQVYSSAALIIIQNFKNKKTTTRHRIADSTTKITDKNFNLILKMDARNEADGLALNSRASYIVHIKTFALELGKKSLMDVSLDSDILPYLTKLQGRLKETGYAPHKSTLKYFYNTAVLEYPENKELVKIATYFNQKKRGRNKTFEPAEKEHLSKREIVKMVSGIKGTDKLAIRDRAIISNLYNCAGRVSEFIVLRKQNAKIDGKVPRFYFPRSKTNPRYSPMLDFGLPYLKEFLKVHEFWNEDNPPLFYSFSTTNYGEPLHTQTITKIIKMALRISGIKKNITPHSLRHSKAYHCAIEGMLPSEANALFGWGRSSSMFTYYSQLNDKEIKVRELERAGKLTPEQLEERKEERNAFVMKNCARCKLSLTPDMFVCPRCTLATNKKVASEELKREKEGEDKIKALETDIKDIKNLLKDQIKKEIKHEVGVK